MCCTKYYESTHPSVLRILDTINHFICLQNTCDYMLLNSQLPFLPCQNSSQPQPILQTSSQDKSFGLVSNFVPCISEVENSHCSILCPPTNVCSHLILSFHVQPGPRDGIIQCFIKRDKSTSTYYLYLCLSPGKYQVCALFFSLISFNIVRSNFI